MSIKRSAIRRPGAAILVVVSSLAAGCAVYQPRPLPSRPDLADTPTSLSVDPAKLGLPPLARHRFDPADGLDMTEVAMLAVANNPGLRVARAAAGVGRAQLFAARLLPDPQLGLSVDHPTDATPGLTGAYSAGLSYAVARLVGRGARVDAARAKADQLNLQLLWKEWQVVQRAKTLYVRVTFERRKLARLRRAQRLYSARYVRSAKALREGNVTLDTTGTDLTALLDIDTRVFQLRKRIAKSHNALNALLGLAPETPLKFVPLPPLRFPSVRAMTRAERTLAQRRPDLLALRAGYESQEARVRAAILAQFPAVSIGLTRARDTSDVHTTGLGVTLNLPFLNGNRGQIAVQRATRTQLRQRYQARLDRSRSDLALLRTRQALVDAHHDELAARLPALRRMVADARQAYRAGNIPALTYLNMETTLLNKRIELYDLEETLWSIRVADDTLLAWPDVGGQ
ncbi:MAG: TolC family protein [Gammaproteobacteria bacterium]